MVSAKKAPCRMVAQGCTREKTERKEQQIKEKFITHGVEMQIPHCFLATIKDKCDDDLSDPF